MVTIYVLMDKWKKLIKTVWIYYIPKNVSDANK